MSHYLSLAGKLFDYLSLHVECCVRALFCTVSTRLTGEHPKRCSKARPREPSEAQGLRIRARIFFWLFPRTSQPISGNRLQSLIFSHARCRGESAAWTLTRAIRNSTVGCAQCQISATLLQPRCFRSAVRWARPCPRQRTRMSSSVRRLVAWLHLGGPCPAPKFDPSHPPKR